VRAKFRYDDQKAAATDYDEACDQKKVALLRRPGGAVLVLPEQGCWFARPTDGSALWCVVAGSADTVARHAAALRWKKVAGTFEVGAGGAIAVAAAFPAKGTKGSRAKLALPRASYRVEVAAFDDDRGELHVARLLGQG
jgi:hypothetical protein